MRPGWDETFMASAFLSSFRSHDEESKVGAIIVNSEKKEIARGYNGFCSEISDNDLDRTRPGKYKYMVHAETNAVSNLTLKPEKAKIYVTRMPCLNCAKLLWQNNIRDWYVPKSCINVEELAKIKNYSDEENELLQILLMNGLKITYIDFGIDDLMDLVKNNKKFFSYLN
jgi:dCMP deaminase